MNLHKYPQFNLIKREQTGNKPENYYKSFCTLFTNLTIHYRNQVNNLLNVKTKKTKKIWILLDAAVTMEEYCCTLQLTENSTGSNSILKTNCLEIS